MQIVKLTLGPYDEHCYIVKEGNFCAVIDPEINDGEILCALAERGWELTDILITHAHHDHVRGVNGLPKSAALRIHEADAPYLTGTNEAVGGPFVKEDPIARPFVTFRGGDIIGPFTVMHVPGHSPGCCLFIAPGHIFSGDSLFVRGRPMLAFPLSDIRAYALSLEKMRALDPEARLHAGHGEEGCLREALPE